jgi:hypothetical protein
MVPVLYTSMNPQGWYPRSIPSTVAAILAGKEFIDQANSPGRAARPSFHLIRGGWPTLSCPFGSMVLKAAGAALSHPGNKMKLLATPVCAVFAGCGSTHIREYQTKIRKEGSRDYNAGR